jgi:cytochrome c peroxidase
MISFNHSSLQYYLKNLNLKIMSKIRIAGIGLGTLLAIGVACNKENTSGQYESESLKLPSQPYNYQLPTATAAGFSLTDNPQNPISDHGATLGRVLFYDKKLSLNNLVACASCHKQENGFADPVAFSAGFEGKKTTRNAMALTNPTADKTYFWDTRSTTLEELSLQPVRNHIEMGMESMDKLAEKLLKINYYPALFKNAFGTEEINKERIANAMSQFLRSIVTYRSKFDEAKKNNFTSFSASEERGRNLFFTELHCGNCHGGNNFNGIDAKAGRETFNIGLDENYADNGVGTMSGTATLNGAFKVPTLRNVELTAPYMHDGRFQNLEQVVEHYNSQMRSHPNLFPRFRTFVRASQGGTDPGEHGGWSTGGNNNNNNFITPRGLSMNVQEKADLVAFLKTLTDTKMVAEVKYANPFGN